MVLVPNTTTTTLAQNPLSNHFQTRPSMINPASLTTQANSLDSWFALYTAVLNPQVTQQQQIQLQQDANSVTQWLKTVR